MINETDLEAFDYYNEKPKEEEPLKIEINDTHAYLVKETLKDVTGTDYTWEETWEIISGTVERIQGKPLT